jgi:hypothetical protein
MRGDVERRSKGKDKMRNKKKHPYKKGGRNRTMSVNSNKEK